MEVVTETVNVVVEYLNNNQPIVVILAGMIAVIAQYAINRVRKLTELSNYLLALVALPGVTTALASLGTSLHAEAYPWVVVVGQFIYALYERMKKGQQAKVLASVQTPVVAPITPATDY